VEAGVDEAVASPLADAVAGLIVGSEDFVERIRALLRGRAADRAVPALDQLRVRPSLESIIARVLKGSASQSEQWAAGRRSDSGERALAAYLCRRRYGYSCTEVAAALGFVSVSSVSRCVQHVETNMSRYQRRLRELKEQLRRS
jgi:hypothetical protein